MNELHFSARASLIERDKNYDNILDNIKGDQLCGADSVIMILSCLFFQSLAEGVPSRATPASKHPYLAAFHR